MNLLYKRIVSKTMLSASISLAGLTLVGCNKSVDYELQKINSVSAQIFNFGLQSKDNESLAKYLFSIDNSKDVGTITNIKPLPYGTLLKEVSIPLVVAPQSKVIIEGIASSPIEWKEGEKYQLPTNKELRLIVSNSNDENYSYSYKLVIKQYTYEPETISWSKSSISISENILLNRGYTFFHPQKKEWYLSLRNSSKIYQLSQSSSPTLAGVTGLADGETIKSLISNHTSVYALSQKGQVYRLDDMQWIPLEGVNDVYDILGILPSLHEGQPHSLALLTRQGDTPESELQFAKYDGKRLIKSLNPVPNDFPGRREEDVKFSINRVAEYEGASIILCGVTPSEILNQSYRSTWFTSDGLSWGKRQSEILPIAQPISVNFVHLRNTYYRLETSSTGLSIFHSTDLIKWTKSKDVALTNLPLNEVKDLRSIAWIRNNNIMLMTSQASVWQGELLDEKTSQ